MSSTEPLPGKHGLDVTDWFESGHTVAELQSILGDTRDWKPSVTPSVKVEVDQNKNPKGKLAPLRTIRLSEVVAEDVTWLWKPFIAEGSFSIIEGEEEGGKTFATLALATAIASGRGLPLNSAEEPFEPATVVLMSAEDSLPHTIKPRLESMNAPCERIIAIDEPFTLDSDGVTRLAMVLAEHEPKLLIIDPLFSYAGKINIDRDNEIRSVTDRLIRLGEKFGCSIGGVRHIGKAKGHGDPRAAGLNGIAWRAAARSVLLVGKDPDDGRKRAIVQTKNNLGPRYPKAIGFEIRDGQFFWTGESSLTAERMLGRSLDADTRSEHNDTVTFLMEALSGGEREAKDVENEANKFGITTKQLRSARMSVGVLWRREGFGKGSKIFWRLPQIEAQESLLDAL